jgi:[ribosomal protein S18]-alanine N-acetyltransferase
VIVRPATPDDADAVAVSELENLGADAWSANLVAEGVRGHLPTVHYLVAEEGGVVVGHAVASLVGDVGELQRIAVNAERRRHGLAGELLDAVVGLAAEGGAERLLLEVREDNLAALAFSAGHGFQELDRRPRYYRDGATAVVMERSIPRPVRLGPGGPDGKD